jgi:hypothetical protein
MNVFREEWPAKMTLLFPVNILLRMKLLPSMQGNITFSGNAKNDPDGTPDPIAHY